MALSKEIVKALNKQFNEELNSAYIYDSMSADFFHKKFPGFASWMIVQAKEERGHAERIHRYLDEQDERVFHAAMEAPQTTWKSPLEILQAALNHEKYISACINEIYNLAREKKDTATEIFLHWFVTEQVEEESAARNLIEKLEMIGDSKYGLYLLDKEVSTRSS